MILYTKYLKNPKLLKEYIIKHGNIDIPKKGVQRPVYSLFSKNIEKFKKCVDNYTRSDLELLKKVLKNNYFIYKNICKLKGNSVKDYIDYERINDTYNEYDTANVVKDLRKENSKLLAKLEKRTTRVVGVDTCRGRTATIYILDIPSKIVNEIIRRQLYGSYLNKIITLYPLYGVKEVKISTAESYSDSYSWNIQKILRIIMLRNPERIYNIEVFATNLLKLPAYKVNKLAGILKETTGVSL